MGQIPHSTESISSYTSKWEILLNLIKMVHRDGVKITGDKIGMTVYMTQ